MLTVVHAIVSEKEKRASCITVWDVFHVLLNRTFVSELRTKKPKNLEKKTKKPILKTRFLQPCTGDCGGRVKSGN